mmetsp:Transcript_19889/g.31130  ORF Transcript_19889/g.31130 Transcript_19889/m.31130 type:complete len:99 (+) Transcript_19889:1186-1482(+)
MIRLRCTCTISSPDNQGITTAQRAHMVTGACPPHPPRIKTINRIRTIQTTDGSTVTPTQEEGMAPGGMTTNNGGGGDELPMYAESASLALCHRHMGFV